MLPELERIWPEWRAERLLGEGSYGKVYKISRKSGEMTVYSALKVINIPISRSEIRDYVGQGMDTRSIRSMFLAQVRALENEIRIMESLKTAANIVSIEDFYMDADPEGLRWTFYIRMELLESLGHYLEKNGPMGTEEVLKLGMDLCDALTCCEQNSIIHRDIKPANIFRNRYGSFKLGDFGIAKQMDSAGALYTRAGTPSYEAPEILNGRRYDHTVDIYSLGTVLYTYMNRGRRPFLPPHPQVIRPEDVSQALELRKRGVRLPPPVSADERFASIILKAADFLPENRYQSAGEMKAALEAYRYSLRNGGFPERGPLQAGPAVPGRNAAGYPGETGRNGPGNTAAPGSYRTASAEGSLRRPPGKRSRKGLVIAGAVTGALLLGGILFRILGRSGESEKVLPHEKKISIPQTAEKLLEAYGEDAVTVTDADGDGQPEQADARESDSVVLRCMYDENGSLNTAYRLLYEGDAVAAYDYYDSSGNLTSYVEYQLDEAGEWDRIDLYQSSGTLESYILWQEDPDTGEVWTEKYLWDDTLSSITWYDENGESTRFVSYDREGNPESAEEYDEEGYVSAWEWYQDGVLENRYENTRDTDGRLLSAVCTDGSGKELFTVDYTSTKDGWIEREDYTYPDGTADHTIYHRDRKGQLSDEYRYNAEGACEKHIRYQRNDAGAVIAEYTYSGLDELLSRKEYTYREDGSADEVLWFNRNGELYRTDRYLYDRAGLPDGMTTSYTGEEENAEQ